MNRRTAIPIPSRRLAFRAVLILACALSTLALPATGWAARLPGLLTQTSARHPFSVRPAVVIYTGDGSGVLGGFDGNAKSGDFGHLSWSSWTTRAAGGTGAVWLDNCAPSCAEGTFSPYAVKVRAFAPHNGYFTRMTLSYDYGSEAIADERGVSRLSAPGAKPHYFYEYYIVHQTSKPLPAQ